MPVKHTKDVASTPVSAGKHTDIQVLISSDEGPNFAMRRFVIAPGGGIPRHTNTVEHEQFILGGEARIGIGEETYEVKPGDVVLIPAGVPHWYENTGKQDFAFLCLIPNMPDKIEFVTEKSC